MSIHEPKRTLVTRRTLGISRARAWRGGRALRLDRFARQLCRRSSPLGRAARDLDE